MRQLLRRKFYKVVERELQHFQVFKSYFLN